MASARCGGGRIGRCGGFADGHRIAQLIGFDPVVGLYAAILPLVVYAVLGTSPHLIVNPDAATCAMVGATLMPLTALEPNSLVSLSMVLAIFTGIICILASFLRLGFVADFLSKPILVGFLNGVAIHIFLGQIGKVFGFRMQSHGIFPSLLEFLQKLPQTHLPTLAVGVLTIGVILAGKRWLAEVARTLTGSGLRGGARSKHGPGWNGGRGGRRGTGGIAASEVAGIRPRVYQAAAGRGTRCGALELQQRDGGRSELRGQGRL